ncbi:Zinc finger protein JAGGED [Carex littledalei]|uniref:Zinc finger protein JAGGED n=1 Tax=Carex littledalei TaxID=544730 RepID=A0A833RCN2_9POAL|nr:Zinc finger protein JAGGED [Carex littledalei]
MEGGGSPAKTYPCKFCDQVFVTAQALGGHQNSHRHQREAMRKAREERERLFLLAPPPFEPLLPPNMPTHIPNFRNDQNSLGDISQFHGPTRVPNRMVPKEYYFQPFAHQQHIRPNKNCYFGTRNHSNNPYATPAGSAFLLSGHHMDSPSYYEGVPRSYDFFANDTTGIANQLNTNQSSTPIEGVIVGPSTAVVMKETGEKSTDNNDRNDKTGIELDLTLRL